MFVFLIYFSIWSRRILYYRTKVHVSIRAKMYICKFWKFRCVDVDSFVRICLKAITAVFLYKHFMFTSSPPSPPFVQMGQQLSCLISLRYLIYDREIINIVGILWFCIIVVNIFFNIWNQPAFKMRTELPCHLWVFWINLVWLKWTHSWAIWVYIYRALIFIFKLVIFFSVFKNILIKKTVIILLPVAR